MKQTFSFGLLLAFSAAGVPATPLAQHPAATASAQLGVTGPQMSPPTTAAARQPGNAAGDQVPLEAGSVPGQSAASATAERSAEAADPAAPAFATLDMTLSERQYFQFGYILAHSAFTYAELTKRSAPISRLRSKLEQIHQLASLAPLAKSKRAEVHDQLATALDTMRNLNAPAAATALIQQQADEYGRPLTLSSDAKQLADFDPDAGQALAALDEFERTSGIPENPVLHDWMASPSTTASGRVWYAEGLIAGIAQIASQQQMPELLPPLADITTDLRGLRDWLATRTPDHPSPTLVTLKSNLDAFLKQTGRNHRSHRTVTLAELATLGDVSQQLAVEILGPQSQVPPVRETRNVAAPPARASETNPGARSQETPKDTPAKP